MKRRHDMPFGATVVDRDFVRFRLWAPAARAVDLCLESGDREEAAPMSPRPGGWYELDHRSARLPLRYRYRVDGGQKVPDPASRFNPLDAHGPSEVVDPGAFDWDDAGWKGRPWHEAVIYELHVGAFSGDGTYRGVEDRLAHLVELGATALELMPLAEFPGRRGWGYDGVLPFAPESAYGRPEDLKRLVQAAHRRGLMVLIDVVYNHFGPEGNYLHLYAPQFFTDRHQTPWGRAINFDGPDGRVVRDFFIHNALYWLEEFHMDGLRLDAVHAIHDDSRPDFLTELAAAVQRGPGRERHVHLVLENDLNSARRLERDTEGRPKHYVAQWNDDAHHAFHVLLTGEADGYYSDYSGDPIALIGRCLTEGYAYQGEPSAFRHGEPRGEPSAALPPGAFISFLQNHDQVGNRAFGDRLAQLVDPRPLAAAAAIVLLAPSPPLIFMGEEFGAVTPFLFFCDLGPELSAAVTEGRRREFARFPQFRDPSAAAAIPDPCAAETFEHSRLDWTAVARPPHSDWLALYRRLLALRHREVVPLLGSMKGRERSFRKIGERCLHARWRAGDDAQLVLYANLGGTPQKVQDAYTGRLVYSTAAAHGEPTSRDTLAPWSVTWMIQTGNSKQ
jgi:maltooligosyltrehalose trehalohydrolase